MTKILPYNGKLSELGSKALGYLSQSLVCVELAKQGIIGKNVGDDVFPFDIITDTGVKIEVKSSVRRLFSQETMKNPIGVWSFTFHGDVDVANFFVLVGLEDIEQRIEYHFWVLSREELKKLVAKQKNPTKLIRISKKSMKGKKYLRFYDKWDKITEYCKSIGSRNGLKSRAYL